jgi:hypothetical protein
MHHVTKAKLPSFVDGIHVHVGHVQQIAAYLLKFVNIHDHQTSHMCQVVDAHWTPNLARSWGIVSYVRMPSIHYATCCHHQGIGSAPLNHVYMCAISQVPIPNGVCVPGPCCSESGQFLPQGQVCA